jgi:hypothetical protein
VCAARWTRRLRNFFAEHWQNGFVEPLLPNPSVSNFPAQAPSWSDLARLCRRVCVLRERGLAADAERVRAGELTEMLAALRTPDDTEETIAQRLAATFAVEAERVANAAVLAELLAPLIAEHTRPATGPVAMRSDSTSPLPVPKPAPRAGPLDLADFIDDMIAQERPPPSRTGPAVSQRRAS